MFGFRKKERVKPLSEKTNKYTGRLIYPFDYELSNGFYDCNTVQYYLADEFLYDVANIFVIYQDLFVNLDVHSADNVNDEMFKDSFIAFDNMGAELQRTYPMRVYDWFHDIFKLEVFRRYANTHFHTNHTWDDIVNKLVIDKYDDKLDYATMHIQTEYNIDVSKNRFDADMFLTIWHIFKELRDKANERFDKYIKHQKEKCAVNLYNDFQLVAVEASRKFCEAYNIPFDETLFFPEK